MIVLLFPQGTVTVGQWMDSIEMMCGGPSRERPLSKGMSMTGSGRERSFEARIDLTLSVRLTHIIIHEGSSRKRADAKRDGHSEA